MGTDGERVVPFELNLAAPCPEDPTCFGLAIKFGSARQGGLVAVAKIDLAHGRPHAHPFSEESGRSVDHRSGQVVDIPWFRAHNTSEALDLGLRSVFSAGVNGWPWEEGELFDVDIRDPPRDLRLVV